VIDDDQDIVDVFCELLNMIKVDILATGNDGKEAIKLYEKHKPDIVFTALEMQRFDGFYAVESIKDKYPKAKIVIVTGDLNARNSSLLNSLNIPVINKPLDIHTVKQIITDVFWEEDKPLTPFKIQYKFKDDDNQYSCTLNYRQYRNFKELPIIQECKVVENSQKNNKAYQKEMQKALDKAIQNDTSHILKLSEIVK
jgi:CheY-like chemotaxis protein